MRRNRDGHQETPLQVGVDNSIPCSFGLLKRHIGPDGVATKTSGIDQDIYTREALYNACYCTCYLCPSAYIDLQTSYGRSQCSLDLPQFLFITSNGDDSIAVMHKSLYHRSPHAAATASNHNHALLWCLHSSPIPF